MINENKHEPLKIFYLMRRRHCGVQMCESTLNPPPQIVITYNHPTIKFFGNVLTSHFGLLLFVLSIFD